jgi:hypothetical protein
MASGYRMVDHYFPKGNEGFATTSASRAWRFCGVQSALNGGEHHSDMLKALDRSDKLFFKWFPSPKWMARFAFVLVLALLAGVVWAADALGGSTGVLILLGAVLLGGVLLALPDDLPVVALLSLLAKVPVGIVCAVVAPLVAWPYLWTLNRLYLASGRTRSSPSEWDPG